MFDTQPRGGLHLGLDSYPPLTPGHILKHLAFPGLTPVTQTDKESSPPRTRPLYRARLETQTVSTGFETWGSFLFTIREAPAVADFLWSSVIGSPWASPFSRSSAMCELHACKNQVSLCSGTHSVLLKLKHRKQRPQCSLCGIRLTPVALIPYSSLPFVLVNMKFVCV